MKKFIDKKKSFFQKIIERNDLEKNKIYLEYLGEFLKEGQERFVYKTVLWEGEEPEDVEVSIFNVINSLNIKIKSNAIIDFLDNKISYGGFLSKFSPISIYYQILHLKKGEFAPAALSTDLSLMFMLSLTYFPEEADLIGEQLIRFLEHHKQKEDEKNFYKGRMKDMFGYSDIVWLSGVVSEFYNKEDLASKIKSYCNENVHPTYKRAVENLLSNDEDEVTLWVDEMIDFHVSNSKSDLTLPFNHEEWQYFPIEIIALLELRLKKGLEVKFIKNSFLHDFIPHLGIPLPIEIDELTNNLRATVLK